MSRTFMILIRCWPLTSRSNLWVNDMTLCLGHSFLSFHIVILYFACECITMVQCVAYFHDLCMTLTFDLNIKILFIPWIWVLLFDIGIPIFGICVYYYEITCCVHSWPLYDLDLWQTYMGGVSLVSFKKLKWNHM